jgi:hypothetical protein
MDVILAFAVGAGAGTSPPQNHVDGWGIVSSPYVSGFVGRTLVSLSLAGRGSTVLLLVQLFVLT